MSTKANFPNGMESVVTIDTEYFRAIELSSNGFRFASAYGTPDVVEYRARQICALPKIVELLKEVSEQSLFFENDYGEYEVTEYHHGAKAILREIGEIE